MRIKLEVKYSVWRELRSIRPRVIHLALLLCIYSLSVELHAGSKLSIGQYRILDGEDSYSYTPVSIKQSTRYYRGKLTLPYINGYRGRNGLGNASIKLSYLTQWNKTFIDLNYRQKISTAKKELTLPVRDSAISFELSRYILGGIGFTELGYTWRKAAQANIAKRKDSFYYSFGGLYPVSTNLTSGIILDHKPTALGRLDQNMTLFSQYKLNTEQRLVISFAKGLTTASPAYLMGLTWSYKFN